MQKVISIAGRLQHHWNQRGLLATLGFLASRLLRHQVTVVYEASLLQFPPDPEWREGEQLIVIGPDDLETAAIPGLRTFLGGSAYECLLGIRGGDRLFIITEQHEYVHRGYVMLGGRAAKLLGESGHVPVVGYCYTVPTARGRGLYRRALLAEMHHLKHLGYKRAIIDTHPTNHASRKGIEAAGFVFLRNVSVWIILNLVAIQRTEAAGNTRWRLVPLLGRGQ